MCTRWWTVRTSKKFSSSPTAAHMYAQNVLTWFTPIIYRFVWAPQGHVPPEQAFRLAIKSTRKFRRFDWAIAFFNDACKTGAIKGVGLINALAGSADSPEDVAQAFEAIKRAVQLGIKPDATTVKELIEVRRCFP